MLKSIAVKDYMSANLVTFTADMDVLTAIHKLLENGISGAPVVDEHGTLIGMLSERDCLQVALDAGYNGEPGGKVGEYMNRSVSTVHAETSIIEVARMFVNGRYRRYPVLEENRVVGQISRRDVFKALGALW
jgi:CBS domain-containing protein